MNCPRCGSNMIGFREYGFANMTGYQCTRCNFNWLQPGSPQPIRELRRNAKEFLESFKIYCLHGLVVWAIAAVIHFMIVVVAPIHTIASLPKKEWASLTFFIVGAGLSLGASVLGALDISSRFWPERRLVHIFLPLCISASVGGLYSVFLSSVLQSNPDLEIIVRHQGLTVAIGVFLAMGTTPVIIVRSSAKLRKKGFRLESRPIEDNRWRH